MFELGRRRNNACGNGDLQSCHLIQPSLMLSRRFVQPLAGLQCDQEQQVHWDCVLTAERFKTSSTSDSLNIFSNTSKGRSTSSRNWRKLPGIATQDNDANTRWVNVL